MKKHKLVLIMISIISLLILSIKNQDQIAEPISAKSVMVVCSERNASEIGLKVLKEGGNAVDAAIAMSFALAVTYPGAGNIGGGGFLIYYRKDGVITSIDFREKAPLNSNPQMFLDKEGNIINNANHEGILSAGVPGTVAGLEMAHKKYGKLDWKELVEPAINFNMNISEAISHKRIHHQWMPDPRSPDGLAIGY